MSTRRLLTPSSWHTLLTGNSFGMRTDEEMRRLEATGTCTDNEINHLAKEGKQRGLSRVVIAGVAGARMTKRVPPIGTTRMRMAMAILSFIIYGTIPSDMSPGNICHRGTNYLIEKYVGPTVSLEIVAGEGIPVEHSPVKISQRQVAGETFLQRQVAGESPKLSLENVDTYNGVTYCCIMHQSEKWIEQASQVIGLEIVKALHGVRDDMLNIRHTGDGEDRMNPYKFSSPLEMYHVL
uniref:Phosphomevalonate kinase, peroxisomal-like n=1 Tax=Tanacetum cinerariifolium TaxID=118510 RepID=A0A699L727_TANCI|nr:phosphomevalonate kinase, peroxisomal-like [Tanacetum cinerariifolium]